MLLWVPKWDFAGGSMLLGTYWRDRVEIQIWRIYVNVGYFVEEELMGEKLSFHHGGLHYSHMREPLQMNSWGGGVKGPIVQSNTSSWPGTSERIGHMFVFVCYFDEEGFCFCNCTLSHNNVWCFFRIAAQVWLTMPCWRHSRSRRIWCWCPCTTSSARHFCLYVFEGRWVATFFYVWKRRWVWWPYFVWPPAERESSYAEFEWVEIRWVDDLNWSLRSMTFPNTNHFSTVVDILLSKNQSSWLSLYVVMLLYFVF